MEDIGCELIHTLSARRKIKRSLPQLLFIDSFDRLWLGRFDSLAFDDLAPDSEKIIDDDHDGPIAIQPVGREALRQPSQCLDDAIWNQNALVMQSLHEMSWANPRGWRLEPMVLRTGLVLGPKCIIGWLRGSLIRLKRR